MKKIAKIVAIFTLCGLTTTMLPTIRLKNCGNQFGGRPLNSHKTDRLLNRKIERENCKILELEEKKFRKQAFSKPMEHITCNEATALTAGMFLFGVIGWIIINS